MGLLPFYRRFCRGVEDKPLFIRMRDGLNGEGRVVELRGNNGNESLLECLILRVPIARNELLERKLPQGGAGSTTNIIRRLRKAYKKA